MLNRFTRFTRFLPPELQGAWQYMTDVGSRSSWGGPFNGQQHRQLMVREILAAVNPTYVLETGTYRGTSTEFLAAITSASIHTFESSRHNYGYSATRLLASRNVHVSNVDSRSGLKSFFTKHSAKDARIFCYLDAHWNDDLPLRDELVTIFTHAPTAVVMVDDFQVEDDAGYSFDDYGADKALNAEYLRPITDRFAMFSFYPSALSGKESGAQRGSIVVTADGATARILATLPTLRAVSLFRANDGKPLSSRAG